MSRNRGHDGLADAVLGLRAISGRLLRAADAWFPPAFEDAPLREPDRGTLVVLGAIALAIRLDRLFDGTAPAAASGEPAAPRGGDAGSLLR